MRIVWFRRDLRLADNPALAAATANGRAVAPVYVHGCSWPGGAAARAWLALSLDALDASLAARGSRLVRRSGDPATELASLAAQTGARDVFAGRDWSPEGMAEEARVARALEQVGARLHVSEGQLLVVPDAVRTADGRPFSVFTPFHRAWLEGWHREAPLPVPARIPAPDVWPASHAAPASPEAATDVARWWTPGEDGGRARLAEFVAHALERYSDARDLPAVRGTSELSPHLTFGELSPRQIAMAALDHGEDVAAPFVRQLAWREFAAHILHAHPGSATRPLRPEFERFPWHDDPDALAAWKAGLTGFPLVDAGMRQLAATGWMHNRVRLVCGSFLTKDLLVPWQAGAEYFGETLVDHDPASNVFNWQWVAGSGADAAPFFRIFNPWLQATRFDPDGEYVRRWVPEIDSGEYPAPMLDHGAARERALAALAAVKRG